MIDWLCSLELTTLHCIHMAVIRCSKLIWMVTMNISNCTDWAVERWIDRSINRSIGRLNDWFTDLFMGYFRDVFTLPTYNLKKCLKSPLNHYSKITYISFRLVLHQGTYEHWPLISFCRLSLVSNQNAKLIHMILPWFKPVMLFSLALLHWQ